MQRRRTARAPVDGVLVLDKPAGLSSNAAMLWARRLLNAPKAGHGGTLDPLATGVLPVLLGEATKFAADLLDADKVYEATLALGVTTTTGDAEGEILARSPVRADVDVVRAACAAFVGEIEQVPPMHSALKRDGRPLYAYARDGVTLEREARRVRIHALDVLDMALDAAEPWVRLRVRCSKGTYVRTLAEDIGRRIGCGAHLSGLRRTGAGAVSIAQALTPQALEALAPAERVARLLPIDALLQSLARVELTDALAARFTQGQRIGLEAAAFSTAPGPAAARVRVYLRDRLLGVAALQPGGVLAPLRLVAQPQRPARSALAPEAPAPAKAEPAATAATAPISTPIPTLND